MQDTMTKVEEPYATPSEQAVRFRTVVKYEGTYTGRGEFYTGIRTGERVTVLVQTQTYTNREAISASVNVSIQSVERPGAWLSLGLSPMEHLEDLTCS